MTAPQKSSQHSGSLHPRCNVTPVSNVCKAVLMSLFWVPKGRNELLKMHFEFHFNLIGKLTMAVLTGQSWHIPKSWPRTQGFH